MKILGSTKTDTDKVKDGQDAPKLESVEVVLIRFNLVNNSYHPGGDSNTRVALGNCAPCTKCITHVNDEHIDNAYNLDIIISMYNLIEYSHNYSDTSGRQFLQRRLKHKQWKTC